MTDAMRITPTRPDRCCDDYLEYAAEVGASMPGTLLRVGKHLLAHRGTCDVVVFLSTRKRHGHAWVKGFRATRLKAPRLFLEEPDRDYLQSLLTVPKNLPSASRADVCNATGLPSQCAYEFGEGTMREVRVYRCLSGECSLCSAMVGPNLLAAAGMTTEAEAAAREREEHLEWVRDHKPLQWQTMRISDTQERSATEVKRVWKPLDINGLRLYRVAIRFPGHPEWNMDKIVAAQSPTNAIQVVQQQYEGSEWVTEPTFDGYALNVCYPEDWWEMERLSVGAGESREGEETGETGDLGERVTCEAGAE